VFFWEAQERSLKTTDIKRKDILGGEGNKLFQALKLGKGLTSDRLPLKTMKTNQKKGGIGIPFNESYINLASARG